MARLGFEPSTYQPYDRRLNHCATEIDQRMMMFKVKQKTEINYLLTELVVLST